MYIAEKSNRMIGLAVTTAMAGVMLAGCAGGSAPQASVSAAEAQQAIASGKHKRAIEHAEAAVSGDPRNAAYRATLGQAYLDAGRFASASTSFQDAVDLGDTSARTALSHALALTGEGRLQEAQDVLHTNEGRIAAADLGLAMALAGDPQGAIRIMSNAIRGGENTVKMRQNLAYSFALAGRWREARLMAAQDVPASMVGERMEEWAVQSNPQAYRTRLASLLDVPVNTVDTGQPVHLALSNNPSADQLAAHALEEETSTELAALDSAGTADAYGDYANFDPAQDFAVNSEQPAAPVADNRYASVPTGQSANFADSFIAPGNAPRSLPQQDAGSYLAASSRPAPAPARAVRKETPHIAAAAATPFPTQSADGTHLVQLGSFATPQGAERAKAIYLRRYPDLDGEQMVVTQAIVRGKRYWRVSAAGYNKADSSSMCARVQSDGEGCIAWAEGKPLPGAIDTGTRLARR